MQQYPEILLKIVLLKEFRPKESLQTRQQVMALRRSNLYAKVKKGSYREKYTIEGVLQVANDVEVMIARSIENEYFAAKQIQY